MSNFKQINFGIIGCGIAGEKHALAISKTKNTKLVAVCSKSNLSAIKLASKYAGTIVMDVNEMIKSKKIDVVCICSPNFCHSEQVLYAISNKKHVIVEKPLAMDIISAQNILSLSKKNNVLVSVVFPRRFDKTWSTIYELFMNKILGEIHIITLEQFYYRSNDYYKNSNWHGKKELDGGILLTQGVHYIDLLANLISASYPNDQIKFDQIFINTIGTKTKNIIEFPDTVFGQFLIKNKVIGSIHISTSAYPGWNSRIFISCKQGSMAIADDTITSWGIDNVLKPTGGTNGWSETSVIPIINDMVHALINHLPLKFDLKNAVNSLDFTFNLDKSKIIF